MSARPHLVKAFYLSLGALDAFLSGALTVDGRGVLAVIAALIAAFTLFVGALRTD